MGLGIYAHRGLKKSQREVNNAAMEKRHNKKKKEMYFSCASISIDILQLCYLDMLTNFNIKSFFIFCMRAKLFAGFVFQFLCWFLFALFFNAFYIMLIILFPYTHILYDSFFCQNVSFSSFSYNILAYSYYVKIRQEFFFLFDLRSRIIQSA